MITALLLAGAVLSAVAAFAQTEVPDMDQDRFDRGITESAERYIDIPSNLIKGMGVEGELDNSHLFHMIYHEAAQKAGLQYLGYAPMDQLLERTVAVDADKLRVGDLFVLNDGLAAMVYKLDSKELYHLIYVSEKRNRVVSFNNRNLVFEVYWMKNLKGFYRLTPHNFYPNG